MSIQIHEDKSPGLQTGLPAVTEHHPDGLPSYFKATVDIGSVFGAEVEGGLAAYGRTREQALERLENERAKLYESLWA